MFRFWQDLAPVVGLGGVMRDVLLWERTAVDRHATLVLAGEEDILVPVSLQRELHSLIPGAMWATTPGGHACMWESPDEFNRIVLEFLGSHV